MSSKEVSTAVGEAPDTTTALSAVEQLDRKRGELAAAQAELARAEAAMDVSAVIAAKQRVEVLRGFIPSLEAKATEEREREGKAAAEKRCVAISRAGGSVAASIADDEQKLVEAAEAYVARVQQLNKRYRQYEGLAAEGLALRDRFNIPGAKLPPVIAPDQRQHVVAAVRRIDAVPYASGEPRRPDTEELTARGSSHALARRRTYREVEGTPAYSIIMAAGLRPWTDEEKARVEKAEREQATIGGSAELELEATIAKAFPPGIPAGSVHRG